ncbi:hypothetical protein BSLG_004026 [Batrachochytrium salamandrivorans]|nr:hypothetical protein BSLG_004026 [Batrachochytrium salamandrivorans]
MKDQAGGGDIMNRGTEGSSSLGYVATGLCKAKRMLKQHPAMQESWLRRLRFQRATARSIEDEQIAEAVLSQVADSAAVCSKRSSMSSSQEDCRCVQGGQGGAVHSCKSLSKVTPNSVAAGIAGLVLRDVSQSSSIPNNGTSATDLQQAKSSLLTHRVANCGSVYVAPNSVVVARYNDHVRVHALKRQHHLVMNIDSFDCWCYACSCDIVGEQGNNKIILESRRILEKHHRPLRGASLETSVAQSPSFSSTPVAIPGSASSSSSSKKARVTLPRNPGLVNIGNTCFFNSMMQNYFDFFRTMRQRLLSDTVQSVNPRSLFSEVSRQWESYSSYRQQDSHELLRRLLDGKDGNGRVISLQQETFVDDVLGQMASIIIAARVITLSNDARIHLTGILSMRLERLRLSPRRALSSTSSTSSTLPTIVSPTSPNLKSTHPFPLPVIHDDAILPGSEGNLSLTRVASESGGSPPSSPLLKSEFLLRQSKSRQLLATRFIQTQRLADIQALLKTLDPIDLEVNLDRNKGKSVSGGASLSVARCLTNFMSLKYGEDEQVKPLQSLADVGSQLAPMVTVSEFLTATLAHDEKTSPLNTAAKTPPQLTDTLSSDSDTEIQDMSLAIPVEVPKPVSSKAASPVKTHPPCRAARHKRKVDAFVPFEEWLDLGSVMTPSIVCEPSLTTVSPVPSTTSSPSFKLNGVSRCSVSVSVFLCRGRKIIAPIAVRFMPSLSDLKSYRHVPIRRHGGKYRLYAVVVHSGSIFGGHYVAYVRVPPTQRLAEFGIKGTSMDMGTEEGHMWTFCSDSTVRVATLDEVLKCQAYILFYERTNLK